MSTPSIGKAHPDDLLIILWPDEVGLWPEFERHQIVSAESKHALQGRRSRRIWITSQAEQHAPLRLWEQLSVLEAMGAVVDRAGHFRPHVPARKPVLGRVADWLFDTFIFTGKGKA